MSTLTIQVPSKLKARLESEAERAGVSPSRIVREALQTRLARVRAANGASLHERSKDLCGSVNGGPRDLASGKRHLAGYGSRKR